MCRLHNFQYTCEGAGPTVLPKVFTTLTFQEYSTWDPPQDLVVNRPPVTFASHSHSRKLCATYPTIPQVEPASPTPATHSPPTPAQNPTVHSLGLLIHWMMRAVMTTPLPLWTPTNDANRLPRITNEPGHVGTWQLCVPHISRMKAFHFSRPSSTLTTEDFDGFWTALILRYRDVFTALRGKCE